MPRLEDENDIASAERERLEKLYGKVLNTEEFLADFELDHFEKPFAFAVEKATGKRVKFRFQDYPRFFFYLKELP